MPPLSSASGGDADDVGEVGARSLAVDCVVSLCTRLVEVKAVVGLSLSVVFVGFGFDLMVAMTFTLPRPWLLAWKGKA